MDRRALAVILIGALTVGLVIGVVTWSQHEGGQRVVIRHSDRRACQFVDRAVMTYSPADRATLLGRAERTAVPDGEIHTAVSEAIRADEAGEWLAADAQPLVQACHEQRAEG